MGFKERAAQRRLKMVGHRAMKFDEAEAWDLVFWQSQTPEQRLSALAAIRRDVDKVLQSRKPRKQTSKRGK